MTATTFAKIPYNLAVGAEIDDITGEYINKGEGGISGRTSTQRVLRNFHVTVNPLDTDGQEVLALYATHRKVWPFGIRDNRFYQLTNEVLSYTADGTFTYASLRQRIAPTTGGSRYWHRRVLIADETERTATISVGGSPIARGVWSFSDFGIAKIPNAYVSSPAVVTFTGDSLVPVCFSSDIASKVYVKNIFSVDIQCGEIFEAELIARMAQTDDSE